MFRSLLVRVLLGAALVLTIPAAGAAQADTATPEGTEWHLVQYTDGDRLTAGPWWVDATLMLDGGTASGSTGCNGFSGTYEVSGDSLQFGAAFAITEMACPEPQMSVESSYMAVLPQTASWAIDTGPTTDDQLLHLRDADGRDTLVFALPAMGLTEADVFALSRQLAEQDARIERLTERLDSVRIGTLRDRIKTLESQVQRLRNAASSSNATAFNAAERVLLEAVPSSTRGTCTPRRSQNPAGTVAALQCEPDNAAVRDMAYYLMESRDATKAWSQRMKQYGVKDGPGSCRKGIADAVYYTGGLQLDGCYVNEDGRANLRYVTAATTCRQLVAGETRLKSPALYIAVLGHDGNLRKLTTWAEPTPNSGADALYKPIKRPQEKWSNLCPR
jgi:heat shock protein HslJ